MLLKKILIILLFLLSSITVFGADIYQKIDTKIDAIQSSWLASDMSGQEVIAISSALIEVSQKYEKKYPEHREIIAYIVQDFENFLEEYKEQKGYINEFVSALEIGSISNLGVFQKEFSYEGERYFTLRKFTQNSAEKYLVVQDGSYETFVILASKIGDIAPYGKLYQNSAYKKHQDIVNAFIPSNASPLQNNGITHRDHGEEVFLTADFCPSSKHGFEKEILEEYMSRGHTNIGIAITSSWIAEHGDDYAWLIEQNNSGKLNISWINHTKTHNYSHGVDFEQNFILTPGLSLSDEILDVEKNLLSSGQTPSIFLRYPGLVSNQQIRTETIYAYGLIPLGSNAWLAKGESPEAGSIILIHGNKNEPYGVELMNRVLQGNEFEYGEIESILDEDL